MYPFKGESTFIRNAWYVACLTQELAEGPVGRTIMDQPVVVYRTEHGEVRAMHGLCPHRSYPLALRGKVVGDSLRCAYHGFAFEGKEGRCTAIPSSHSLPGQFRQRVYPVIERGPWVWIWPGDPTLAGDAPSLEATVMGRGYVMSEMMAPVTVKARYMLGVENLMDLTHIGFLHETTAGHNAIVRANIAVVDDEDRFEVHGSNMPSAWGHFHSAIFGDHNRFEGQAEHISKTLVITPGYIPVLAQQVVEIAGKPADPAVFGELWFHHVLTPETATTTHYFGTQTRNFRLHDPDISQFLKQADTFVRSEDIAAMEAIEAQLETFGAPAAELMVRADIGAGKLRRRFQRLIDKEHGPTRERANSVTDPILVD